jgi:hypothetical protein
MGVSGGGFLNERVALVHSMDYRDGRLWLDAAVLLRGRNPGWYQPRKPPDRQRWRPPVASPGGGGGAGRHRIFVDRADRAVWVNHDLRIPLGEFNVLLLDDADELTSLPIVHELFTIAPELGAAPPPASPSPQTSAVRTLTSFVERVDFGAAHPSTLSSPQTFSGGAIAAIAELRKRIEESEHVKTFLRG